MISPGVWFSHPAQYIQRRIYQEPLLPAMKFKTVMTNILFAKVIHQFNVAFAVGLTIAFGIVINKSSGIFHKAPRWWNHLPIIKLPHPVVNEHLSGGISSHLSLQLLKKSSWFSISLSHLSVKPLYLSILLAISLLVQRYGKSGRLSQMQIPLNPDKYKWIFKICRAD